MFNINDLIYGKNMAAGENVARYPTYSEVLSVARDSITENYSKEFVGDLTADLIKDRYRILIQQIIQEKGLYVKEYNEAQLIEMIYNSMVKFDFLTPYIEGNCGALPDNPLYQTWEEINCNSYDDIEVVVAGSCCKLDRAFDSPESCYDMVLRMAKIGGLNLDKSKPVGNSHIGNSIRIEAAIPPCVDADKGAVFSVRRQKNCTNERDFFLNNGTACEDELDLLTLFLGNGISIGIAGDTNTGKTALMNYLLRSVARGNRIVTIEDTRELDAIIKDQNGKYLSRAVHLVTKESEDESQAVTADDLLKAALRLNPDIIGLGEMRGREAKTCIDAGGTGHTSLNGLHAGGQRSAYRRITTLYMDAGTNLSEKMVYENIVEAIPIIVLKKAFKSGERRIMYISEARLSNDLLHPEIEFHKIYQYEVKGFRRENGKLLEVVGEHKKVGNISDAIAQKLFENGVELDMIKKYAGADFAPGKDVE